MQQHLASLGGQFLFLQGVPQLRSADCVSVFVGYLQYQRRTLLWCCAILIMIPAFGCKPQVVSPHPGAPLDELAVSHRVAAEFRHDLPAVVVTDASTAMVTHTFDVQNTTSEELVIQRIRTSCGCTHAELGDMMVSPFGSTELKLTVNGAGRKGRHSFRCFLDVQHDVRPWQFDLNCEFAPFLAFSDREVVPELTATRGHVSTTLLVSALPTWEKPEITRVDCPDDWQWQCRIDEAIVQKSESFIRYEIPFDLSFPDQSTLRIVRVYVRSGDVLGDCSLRIPARATPGFRVTPARLLVKIDSIAKSTDFKLRVQRVDEGSFVLTSEDSSVAGVAVECEADSRRFHEITVRIDPTALRKKPLWWQAGFFASDGARTSRILIPIAIF